MTLYAGDYPKKPPSDRDHDCHYRGIRQSEGVVENHRRAIGESRPVHPKIAHAEKRGDHGRPVRGGYADERDGDRNRTKLRRAETETYH